MTPYQIGFLASRLFAVFCTIMAVTQLTYLLYTLQALSDLPGADGASPSSSYKAALLLPFVIQVLLATAFWVKADWAARAFVPEATADQERAGSGDWGASLFRVLGAYCIAVSLPQIAQSIYSFLASPVGLEGARLPDLLNYAIRTALVADLVRFLIGVLLLFGARRLGRGIAALPTRFMAATSLPDVDPPDAPSSSKGA